MTWTDIKRQAREIARRKTHKGQVRQAKLYFAMVRDALQVRDVQPDPGPDLDPGASAEDAGRMADELIARCKT